LVKYFNSPLAGEVKIKAFKELSQNKFPTFPKYASREMRVDIRYWVAGGRALASPQWFKVLGARKLDPSHPDFRPFFRAFCTEGQSRNNFPKTAGMT
jgi:hypothetical protein